MCILSERKEKEKRLLKQNVMVIHIYVCAMKGRLADRKDVYEGLVFTDYFFTFKY